MKNSKTLNNTCKFFRSEKVILYLLAPFAVFTILMFVFCLKGIYPFGVETVDYYDMGQEVVAFYYHVYDYLHFDKASFIDFYTGLGINMSNGTSGSSIYSLFNIFFLFVKREHILESMSFFLALKLMLMSLSFGMCIRKLIPSSPTWLKFALGITYGMSGFVMMNYTIMTWLDAAAFFPLIVMFADELIRYGKMRGYVIVLTLSIISNYYLSVMILVYLFLSVGTFIFADYVCARKNKADCVDEEPANRHILEFAIGTLISVILSCVSLIPQLCQMLTSSRFGNNYGIKGILLEFDPPYVSRWWILMGVALPLSVCLYAICQKAFNRFTHDKTGKDAVKNSSAVWIFAVIFISCAELFFENVNLLMHFGSYVHYPIRNGFIISFTIAMVGGYFGARCFGEKDWEGNESECTDVNAEKAFDFSGRVRKLPIFIITVIGIAFGIGTIYRFAHFDHIELGGVVGFTLVTGAVFLLLMTVILIVGKGKFAGLALPTLLIVQLIAYSYIFIGPISFVTTYTEEPEQEAEYIRIVNELIDEFDIEPNALARVKNPDESLNANYGLIMKRGTLSNSTHLIKQQAQDAASNLGYSIQYTRLLDAGGTVFTDAMLHIESLISRMDLNSELYDKINSTQVKSNHITGETDIYNLYSCRYKLPFTMRIHSSKMLDELEGSEDIITFQNAAYRALNPDYEESSASSDTDASDDTVTGDFTEILGIAAEGSNVYHINGRKALYFVGFCADQEYKNTTIRVNGETVRVPSIKEPDNCLYPAHFNNGTMFLGNFDDADVNVELSIDRSIEAPDYLAAVIAVNLDMLGNLCDKLSEESENYGISGLMRNHVVCDTYGQNGEYALLPMAYDEGFSAYVNDTKVIPENIKGLFMAVPLENGENHIVLKYRPKGFVLGVLMFAVGILTVIAVGRMQWSANKKRVTKNVLGNASLNRAVRIAYLIVWILAAICLYIVPILCYIAVKVTGI